MKFGRRRPSIAKGLASGLVAGLVASFAMNRFQEIRERWSKMRQHEEGDNPQSRKAEEAGGADATVRTAERLSESILGRGLDREEKKAAGPAVHYAFGTTVGALYGAVTDLWPEASAGAGVPFGTAVWLGADEVALPALKLSRKPTEYPLSTHAYALASHIVYGATAELIRRVVRRAL